MNIRKVVTVFVITLFVVTIFPAFPKCETSPNIEDKLEPWLLNKIVELEANKTSRMVPLIIVLAENWLMADIKTVKNNTATLLIERHGAKDVCIASVLPFLTARVNSTEVRAIAAYEFVKILGDGERTGEWTLDVSTITVHASDVWENLNYNGSGKIIAILDSGINETHPSLINKVIDHIDYTNTGFGDAADHGTHCAGIAAGTGAGSTVGRFYPGVAPGASLLNVKVGTTVPVVQNVVNGVNWAVQHDANVISLSLSLGACVDCALCAVCTVIKSAVERGVTVVIAAGNEGPLSNSITCPGCSEEAITVGAIEDQNTKYFSDDALAGFSSCGPTRDGRPKPDVVAPGCNIMSPNAMGGYSNFSGTSAATPHVAGVAALILQAHPTWTPDMVKYAIKDTAILNDQLVWPNPAHDPENDRGNGTVDASRTVSLLSMNIPANQAETIGHISGNGTYTANAYLNGTYKISAGNIGFTDQGYAIATLNKTFTPEYNSTNPKFFFTFQDDGAIYTYYRWAELRAIFKLFAPNGNTLFTINQQIHNISEGETEFYFDNHTIEHTYFGTLYAQQTYKIEYGFSTYACNGSYADFGSGDQEITATLVSTLDGAIFGPGNPSLEERLMYASVFEVAYWHTPGPYLFNNNSGWRHVRCDLGSKVGRVVVWGKFDGKVDAYDLALFCDAHGKDKYSHKYYWYADFNGDEKIDGFDIAIFIESQKNDKPNYLDGLYSWFTNMGAGDYTISQWLCEHDINAMKGQQINFTFWFKPETLAQNNASAEIHYVLDSGASQTINGTPVCPTQTTWYNPYVVASIPANTIAIKIIIHGGPDFKAWVDKTSITIT